MTKTLYFEGAGWFDADSSKATDVGNCRIRTAFINDKGRQIYLELGSSSVYGRGKQKKEIVAYKMCIDFAFYDNDVNAERTERIRIDHQKVWSIDYNKANIVSWVNSHLDCSFDAMEVLDDMEEYEVHKGRDQYNLMENHIVNPKRTKARKEAYAMIDEIYQRYCQSEYSVISLMDLDDDTITIRCNHDMFTRHPKRVATVNIWTQEVTYKEGN